MNKKRVIVTLTSILGVIALASIGGYCGVKYKNRIQFVTGTNAVTASVEEPYKLGASMGNMSGAVGHAVLDDGWIYYTNVADKDKLYKIKADGTRKKKIGKDEIYGINVSGDWIYYGNTSERGKLYRIRKNGKDREELAKENVDEVKIMGEWIYYTVSCTNCESRKEEYHRLLWKMKLDGTKKTLISPEYCSFLSVLNNQIYCTIKKSEKGISGGMYLMDTDGTIIKKISDDNGSYLNIVDDWIYYCNKSDDYSLYKIKTDGTAKEKLSSDHAEFINVNGDWIYYSAIDEDYHLYRIRTNGSNREKISDDKCLYICVLGERLLYMNQLGEEGITLNRDDHNISIKFDGSDRRELR